MRLDRIIPKNSPVELHDFISELEKDRSPFLPFDGEPVRFFEALSKELLEDPSARGHANLQALGFFIRDSSIRRLQSEFETLQDPRRMLLPRGLVLHFPPSNVDVLFVYSWFFSAIVGNRNLIRLSRTRTTQTERLVEMVNRVIGRDEFKEFRRKNHIISYDHNDAITAALSELSDVRVIWGGDETVRQIRKISIKPSAKEVAFVDRFSICLIDSNDFNEASEETKSELLRRFYNDCYGFDQLACSSPRLLVWRGKTQSCEKASQDFFKRLSSVVRAAGYTVSSSVALEKLSFLYGVAMTDRAQMVSRLSNEVMVARLSNLSDFDRQSCGAGFLYETSVESLLELEPFLSEKDQTLSYFASDRSELQKLPRAIRGRGIERIVPIGEALSFGRYWDGFDLLTEMTKWTVRWE